MAEPGGPGGPKSPLDAYFGRSREELRRLRYEMTVRYQALVASGMNLQEIARMLGAEQFLKRRGRRYVGLELDMDAFIQAELKKTNPIKLPDNVEHIKDVIIPPDPKEVEFGEEGRKYEKPKIFPRTRLLIEVLTELNLAYDIANGENRPNMMRGLSYKAFTIQSLGKIVFVNDEEGNRTFVVHDLESNENWREFSSLGKDDLKSREDDGKISHFIWPGSSEGWKRNLKDYLLSASSKKKSPVQYSPDSQIRESLEAKIRTSLQEQFTPEVWALMTAKQARDIKIFGRGIQSIGTIFGIAGRLTNTAPRLELGLAIWPEDETLLKALDIENRSTEEWVKRIQQVVTPTDWINFSANEAQEFSIDGKGVRFFASIFFTEGDPRNSTLARLRLGLRIWPENQKIKTAIENLKKTTEYWQKILHERINPDTWAEMSQSEAHKFKIENKGIHYIAGVFGVPGNMSMRIPRLELGLKIWPGNPIIQNSLMVETRNLDQWRQRINELYSPEQWVRMTKADAEKLKIDKKGINALKGIFNQGGNPVHMIPRLELGLAIWPGNHEIQQALDQVRERSG